MWKYIAKYASFHTGRVFLRPLSYEDAEDFYDLLSHPENVAYILPSQTDDELVVELLVKDWLMAPLGKWAIVDKTTQKVIGLVRFENIKEEKKRAELGYLIREDYRGHGLMTHVLKNLVYLSFYQFGLQELALVIHLENRASQRVAEKAGFQPLRQFKGSDRYHHKMQSYIEYTINKKEFKLESYGKSNDYD